MQDDGQSINSTFSNGVLASREITDTLGVASYQSISEVFDAAGVISERVKVEDDGRAAHTFFVDGVRTLRIVEDKEGTKPWVRREYTFEESTGSLASVKTVFADGREETQLSFAETSSSTRALVDSNNAHKWHTTTMSFDARGEMVLRERVFDDGRTQTMEFEERVKSTAGFGRRRKCLQLEFKKPGL